MLHAVAVGEGESDIDHVVIGRAGVFTINTKHHCGAKVIAGGGSVTVNRFVQPYVRNSEHEAKRAARFLTVVAGESVTVMPVVALVGVASLVIGNKEPKVLIMRAAEPVRWLERRPVRHSPAAVSFLSGVAVERGTWHSNAVVLDDTLRQQLRFERFQGEVEAARKRRGSLLLLLKLVVIGVPFVAVVDWTANAILTSGLVSR